MVLLATAGPPPPPPPPHYPTASNEAAYEPGQEWHCIHTGCDNKACINPMHLAWGTPGENNVRARRPSEKARVQEVNEAARMRKLQWMHQGWHLSAHVSYIEKAKKAYEAYRLPG